MDGVDESVLAKMPLAEAVLVIWRLVADEDRLQAVFERHRGRCYQQSISFATMVQLVADALLEHQGSGNQSFSRAKEAGSLEASTRAAYGKLGRLPPALSVGLFSEIAGLLRELYPQEVRREPPASLQDATIVTIDGKTIKRVAKRLKPLRTKTGGVLGGKALVAVERATGLAVAMAADLDGDANDSRLVPQLLPQVRQRLPGRRLWVADRGFCDPLQLSRFTEEGDSFVMRYNAKAKFTPDPASLPAQGTDAAGRSFSDQGGWLGREGNAHRRYVRRITLYRDQAQDVSIVTDLVDRQTHPAEDLLALYRERWGVEQMFQQVTEVFGLERLIGGRPEATIFQLAFCLLIYNQLELVRAYVLKHQGWEAETVSLEQLFIDVRRELIAWAVVVGRCELPCRSAAETRRRLDQLLRRQWSDRWVKAIKATSTPPPSRRRSKDHVSAFRVLMNAKRH
jgi:hypothetical protein